jgi:hypothetical protein
VRLDDYKVVFVVVFLVLVLLAASPNLSMIVGLPAGERFTEFWVLGPGHMAEDYPFNIGANASYSVFLGLANHMGGLDYYVAYVKFRNQTESLPNATSGIPSPLPALYEHSAFLSDGETWERNVAFSFSGVSIGGNVCRVSSLNVDGFSLSVNKTASLDAVNKGYYFELFFELWRFNATAAEFQYHSRFVGIWLNMTG